MDDLINKIKQMPPEKQKLLEAKLKCKGIDLCNYLNKIESDRFYHISPVAIKEYYPLSSAQKRIYVINQLEEDQTSYNISYALLLEGPLDKHKLDKSLKLLLKRHESLRTSFDMIDGEFRQYISNEVELKIEYIQIHDKTAEELIRDFIKPFDLSRAPLLKVGLISLSEDKHILVCDMHHIISDGVSIGILARDFMSIYNDSQMSELRIQYKDYSAWQNENIRSDKMLAQVTFWMNSFMGDIPVLNLPTDYPRPAVQSFEGERVFFEADRELTEKMGKIISSTGTTIYMLLLAVFNVLLSKYTGQDDIIVGTPVANRNHADTKDIIGVFINTLAMRNYPNSGKRFIDFLNEVKVNTLNAFDNQDYQFEELIKELQLEKDLSRNPLFNVMLVLHNTESTSMQLADLKITPYTFDTKSAQLDIKIEAIQGAECIYFSIEYCTKLYRRQTIERMTKHFINILMAVTDDLHIAISDINMLTEAERNLLVEEFNKTEKEYECDKTIHELFEAQVLNTPKSISVICADRKLTYEELNSKSNQLARVLIEKFDGSGHIIPLMVDRSVEMVIGLIAILKSGNAYLPIDPSYPAERINYILRDCEAKVLLSKGFLADKINFAGEVLCLEEEILYTGDGNNHGKPCNAGDLAYLIYTSGSTGKPKGVMIEHRAVNNFIKGVTERIGFSSDRVILSLTTISFDIFVLETILPLTRGMKIIVADEEQQIDMELLADLIIKNGVNMIQATPSRMQMILESKYAYCLRDMKEIMVGGESVPAKVLSELNEVSNAKIFNMYGPTETTVWSAISDLTEKETIDIGKPISNTQIYILGRNDSLQPVGIPGELVIAGDSLARGYFKMPEATNEKFVDNPFRTNKKMYRTGDLARWLPDGDIEYLGRMDFQVKIRGYRIELGEIETVLSEHPSIHEAVVTSYIDAKDNSYLCAYYTSDSELTVSEIRLFLEMKLPDYMIPSYFKRIDVIPFTPNGKVNRKVLPEIQTNFDTGVEYIEPQNDIEERIRSIWREVLGIDEISIHDNFFNIGGNSLLCVQVHAKLKEIFQEIKVVEIFRYPTIFKLAEYLSNNPAKYNPGSYVKTKNLDSTMNLFDEVKKGNISIGEAVQSLEERARANE